MRWHFLDRITRFEAWTALEGRKAISLEEYCLLEPLGRKGCLPESLMIESCVHLARWLVTVSSAYAQTCILSELDQFEFDRETSAGSTLNLSLTVTEKGTGCIRFMCRISSGEKSVCRGTMVVALQPLKEVVVAEDMRTMWRELYGQT